MIEDEKIIEMFFGRSEQGIRELDIKYGKARQIRGSPPRRACPMGRGEPLSPRKLAVRREVFACH